MDALFDVQTTRSAQTGEVDAPLRDSLRRAIALCAKSPAQIADELTNKLHRSVTEGLIYAWMAPTSRNRLPADIVPHLCEILENDNIQRLLLSDKLRDALTLGESTQRVVSLLRNALPEAPERKQVEGGKNRKRSKR